ncbi:hypothetical protein [Micromonospora cathayae]|uniref:Uncharacterized protein n=1 Tax=Micromonospora cathayae TaxID=3028804 RepID=A0ABY7ZNV7_9ACTN|nr:hypothetical protein [Micromonospora sp. HUAS 3]WDZ84712.1 hypothetical protein PVK37_30525 [Micromonospora sp. HUAS 3]
MNFLTTHLLASVPAMRVIFDYLASSPQPATTDKIRADLKALDADADRPASNQSDVVTASLRIGRYLDLFTSDPATRPERWSIAPEATDVKSADAAQFSGAVLRQLCMRAHEAASTGQEVPDLALALTWFLDQDPAKALDWDWNDRPENEFGHYRVKTLIINANQWRAFRRWTLALGLAVRLKGKAREALAADPSVAIAHVLYLLDDGPAERWFDRLFEVLPVLGREQLRQPLPYRNEHGGVSPAVALAVRKLALRKFIETTPMDDSPQTVTLRVAGASWTIGAVRTLEKA